MKANQLIQLTNQKILTYLLIASFIAFNLNGYCFKDYSIINSGNCIVDAGSDITICANENATLNGMVSGDGSNGTWSGGNGSFSPNDNALNATYSPSVNEISDGMVTLTLTGVGPCAGETSTVTITIEPLETPTFSIGINTFCTGATIPALPTTSTNSLNGTWSPVINNTTTTLYTFTPDSGECGTTATHTITINAPSIVPTFANPGPYCSGSTIPNLPTTSNNGITGTWSPAINNTTTTEYTFTPSNPNQCGVSTTLTITVNPNVTPTFSNPGPYCEGATIAGLPTTSINGITGTWSPAINNTTTTTYTFTPNNPSQCGVSTTLTINIDPQPTVDAGLDDEICEGNAVTLNGAVTGAAGGIWSGGNGDFTPNESALNASYSPSAAEISSGSVILTLTSTGNGACNAVESTVEITLFALPTISVGSSQIICSGSTTTGLGGDFGGSATGGLWTSDSGGTFSPNITTSNATWTPDLGFDGLATLTFTTTGMEPCTAEEATVTVSVNPNVTASVNYSGNPFCESESLVQSPIITGNSSGTFSMPEGLSITSSGVITPNTSDAGLYSVIYTIPGLVGCPDFVLTLDTIVIANAPDALLYPEFSGFLCENSEEIFSVNTSDYNSYTTFSWSVEDNNSNVIGSWVVNDDGYITYTIGDLSEETGINVILTETIGTCNVTIETPATVLINPETCGFFELAGNVLAACSESNSFYQWGCGSEQIPNANSNSYVYSEGNCSAFWVAISLYEDFSCPVYLGDASQITSVNYQESSSALILYPNPAANQLIIKNGNNQLNTGTIDIYSSDGRLCLSQNVLAGFNETFVDISRLSSGSYILWLTNQEERLVKSFIISK